jgi:hypothetical protein
MRKRHLAAPPTPDPAENSRTGYHCPKSGWWLAREDPGDARFITKGDVMPASGGGPVLWIMKATADMQYP